MIRTKIVAWSSALLVAALTVAGCGSTPATQPTGGSQAPSSSQVAAR